MRYRWPPQPCCPERQAHHWAGNTERCAADPLPLAKTCDGLIKLAGIGIHTNQQTASGWLAMPRSPPSKSASRARRIAGIGPEPSRPAPGITDYQELIPADHRP
jgi:hypothetical protein